MGFFRSRRCRHHHAPGPPGDARQNNDKFLCARASSPHATGQEASLLNQVRQHGAPCSTKAEALARLADAEAQLAAAKGEAPLKADAAARAREEARAAATDKVSAVEASREAERMMSPVSIFISRKTQRLYVRQAFSPCWRAITIRVPTIYRYPYLHRARPRE
jgi:hypothetical protein